MSVLRCRRKGCDNVMCDRWSPLYGYICGECFEELVNKGVHTDIKSFMETPKEEGEERNYTQAYEMFDKEFSRE